ncbi:MAG: HDIG domain-containing protein [Caldilineaceae bacterium]|nr:HDIG domain-containing protein [Caldilineaceae bacterium]
MDWKFRPPALDELISAFRQEQDRVYVVGGAVRDLLLGRSADHYDLDLVVEQDALGSARLVADRLGWAYYPLDAMRDVARLVFVTDTAPPLVCDVAGMRGGSIEADLLARDFTVNAMALAYTRGGLPTLVDVTGGEADLRQKRVRQVTPLALAEDSLRILRAVRLAVQLGFQIDSHTQDQMERLAGSLRFAGAERVRDELWKILATGDPAQGIDMLHYHGILVYVLPEVTTTTGVTQSYPHYQDVYRHTLATVRHAFALRQWILGQASAQSPALAAIETALGPWRFRLRHHLATSLAVGRTHGDWLIWNALLHDIGKPYTRSQEADDERPGETRVRFLGHEERGAALANDRLLALRFSRHEIELATAVIQGHMRPHLLHASFIDQPISRRAAYRFFRDIGGKPFGNRAGIDTVLLALADYQAIYPASPPPGWTAYLDHAGELLAFAFDPQRAPAALKPLLDGHALIHYFDLQPGPRLGDLLEYLREAQAAGDIATTGEALDLATGWLADAQH